MNDKCPGTFPGIYFEKLIKMEREGDTRSA